MRISDKSKLVRLGDTGLALEHPDEDIRGFHVVDSNGEDIGTVNDLMVDVEERKVRFLVISGGGIFGFGGIRFLVPVDAVTGLEIDAGRVKVDRTKEHVTGSPAYDPEIVEKELYYADVYDYYGISPYWGADYIYPPFPFFMKERDDHH